MLSSQANAQMTLTPAAVTAGFSLSTFATAFPNSSRVGPLGIAFNGSNPTQVIVSDYPGNVRVFPTDTDGQTANFIPVAQNYGIGNAVGIAEAGGNYYMTQQSAGRVIQINPNGTSTPPIIANLPSATGIVADPVNGHLFVSAGGEIVDVNPITRTFRLFENAYADGLTTDGTTLYAEVNGNSIIGYRLSDGTKVFDSGLINGGPDGTALGYGTLAGDIFVNTNDGHLLEYNLVGAPIQTVLGSGGSRGDFVTVDPNGTLLLTQTSTILRLTAPKGGSFTPEPGPVALLVGMAVSGTTLLLRRRWN